MRTPLSLFLVARVLKRENRMKKKKRKGEIWIPPETVARLEEMSKETGKSIETILEEMALYALIKKFPWILEPKYFMNYDYSTWDQDKVKELREYLEKKGYR